MVFYSIFGLNSILYLDSLEKIAKNPKKDRIQSKKYDRKLSEKNMIENYPKKGIANNPLHMARAIVAHELNGSKKYVF